MTMRVGILGGTFNPIHIAHLILADEAAFRLSLDKVIFVPCYQPPHKQDEELIDAEYRFKMVELAIKDNPKFEASRVEIDRKGSSYSVDTLKYFNSLYGKLDKIFFISGSDVLKELFTWKDIDEIFRLSNFIVASRPGFPAENLPRGAQPVLITALEISSSLVRSRIREGCSIRYLVPDAVRQFIEEKGLYRKV